MPHEAAGTKRSHWDAGAAARPGPLIADAVQLGGAARQGEQGEYTEGRGQRANGARRGKQGEGSRIHNLRPGNGGASEGRGSFALRSVPETGKQARHASTRKCASNPHRCNEPTSRDQCDGHHGRRWAAVLEHSLGARPMHHGARASHKRVALPLILAPPLERASSPITMSPPPPPPADTSPGRCPSPAWFSTARSVCGDVRLRVLQPAATANPPPTHRCSSLPAFPMHDAASLPPGRPKRSAQLITVAARASRGGPRAGREACGAGAFGP